MPFVRNLFRYDETEHKGYYVGQLVPSITQLLEMIYPLADNIPTKNLKSAAERGTTLHEKIEEINKCDCVSNEYLLDPDCLNYIAFTKTLNLAIHKCEELVFLLDKNKELIAYGHFDFVFKCLDDNLFGNANEFVLGDLKTTSEIYKSKVKLQTELYKVAYMQTFIETLSNRTFVLHLRNGEIKFIPFDTTPNLQETINVAKELRNMWNECQH